MDDFSLEINQKTTYLHVVVTGKNSKENVENYLKETIRECTARKCSKVLIEERLEGPRLGTFDVYSIASKGALQASGKLKAMAYVDVNAEGDLMKFAETVAVNRALPVRVFSTVSEAEKWLLSSKNNN
jgi:hypothetical protein